MTPTSAPVADAPTGDTLLYARVANQLIEEIACGRIHGGSRIPSEAELQTRFSVSRVTIRRALKILETRGLIRRFRRKGSFVIDGVSGRSDLHAVEPTDVRPGLVQFLHVEVSRERMGAFSKGELEAAEQYFAGRGIGLSWSAMASLDLIDGKRPIAIERGLCGGLLVDGHLNPLHLPLIDRFGLPFVVIANHDLGNEWNQVRFRMETIIARFIETARRRQVDELLVLTDPMSFIERQVTDELSRAVLEHGFPPLKIVPVEMAFTPAFMEMLRQSERRYLIKVPRGHLSKFAAQMTNRSGGNDRHRLVFFNTSDAGAREDAGFSGVTSIGLNPHRLATRAAELLDELMRHPGRPPAVIEMEPDYFDP
ncbi:MAG TPA: GntR family transcriptional regulator [Chthoniobacteraceae bacterium]|nr:GntR family transcriptional regulator [Chthoniobacteraceae bacterium]